MSDSKTSPTEPRSILFIGNSLTYVHNVDQWVKKLHESTSSSPLTVSTCVQGGASLKTLWQKTKAKRQISHGGFDVVVLQEDLPETTIRHFEKFSRTFVHAVRASGATPLLYQTWAYERLPNVTDNDIDAAHRKMEEELGVAVADVGGVRRRVERELPHVNLWADDMEHPSEVGAYLAGLVLYKSLFGEEVVLGIECRPDGLGEEDARMLITIVDGLDRGGDA